MKESKPEKETKVVAETTGPDAYSISVSAEFEAAPDAVWQLLLDWERFVEIGLRGMTSNFTWLSGGPAQAPSKFQFEIAGAILKEEIYEQSASASEHVLRYRALEPALGVQEYDAVLRLNPLPGGRCAFEAVRNVRLDPGSSPDMLSEMVRSETQCLADHFST